MTPKTLLLLILLVLFQTLGFGMSKSVDLPEDEFARRRAIFTEELRELNACAILHAAPVYERNHDIEYQYRQDSDFFYLTGWDHPGAILLITPQSTDESKAEVSFFVTPRDPKREIWTGPKPGLGEARLLPGVDQSVSYDEFYKYIAKLITGYERLVISYGNNSGFEQEFKDKYASIRNHPVLVQEASSLLKSYRLIKSDKEVKSLEQAISITSQSLQDVLPLIPSLNYEYEVEAEIEYGFAKRGSVRLGFPSIIGAGKNSTYLHYEENHGKLEDGDVLLLDIGAEWDYYSADITRTVPISGKFSPEQTAIYELVLKAQTAAIDAVKPGITSRKTHDIAAEVITLGLIELGLLEGNVKELIKERAYRKYFMHGTSHWLGLDVHDVGGSYKSDGKKHILQAGMVITVEPGIYISESDDVESRWWNLGIRIEDDVLVTPKGHRVLSASVPKTITEIEALMQP